MPISICPVCKTKQVKLGGYLCQGCEDEMTGGSSSRSRPGPTSPKGPTAASSKGSKEPGQSAGNAPCTPPYTPPPASAAAPDPVPTPAASVPHPGSGTGVSAIAAALTALVFLIVLCSFISSQVKANRSAALAAENSHQQFLRNEAVLNPTPPPTEPAPSVQAASQPVYVPPPVAAPPPSLEYDQSQAAQAHADEVLAHRQSLDAQIKNLEIEAAEAHSGLLDQTRSWQAQVEAGYREDRINAEIHALRNEEQSLQ